MKKALSAILCAVLTISLCAVLVATAFVFFGENVVADEPEDSFVIEDDETGGDCHLIGIWDDPTKTCTLTDSVSKTIIIDDDGITLDGDGYSVTAGSGSYGIYVSGHSEIIIKNVEVSGFQDGIYLYRSSSNVLGNNTISDNDEYGIYLYRSSSNTITNNAMTENGIYIGGPSLEHWNTHTIDTSNTVNGKPVHYWKNKTGGTVPADAGQVILANCTGVVV